jgi:UDP-glucose 4-epimerase
MRVLVVGGAGYIGSVTVSELLASGDEVTVFDNLSTGHREAVPAKARLVSGDVRDEAALIQLFDSAQFDAVIYYGGLIAAGESMQRPGLYFDHNVSGVIALLNTMVAHSVLRFVFSSSAAVYGEPEAVPITEDQPLRPVNPYGETKATIERLLGWYDSQCGLHSVSLRYFNAAGATATLGEDHKPETHLIPIVLQVALGQREHVPLFGSDYPTPDGTCIRDYVHVSDLAEAHLLAMQRCEIGSGVYNLGVGHGFSNLEVVEAARRITGHPIPVRNEPRRAGDPASLVASAEKAKAELGWRPKITELEEIVASAWTWHKNHPNGYGS